MKTYLSKWYWWVFLNKLWGRSLVLGSKFFAVSTPICGRKIEIFTSCAYQLNNDQQLYKFLPRGEELYKHNFLVFHTRCKSAIGELNDIWTESHRCKECNQNCGNNHRGKELPTRYTHNMEEMYSWFTRHVEFDNPQWTALAGYDWFSACTCFMVPQVLSNCDWCMISLRNGTITLKHFCPQNTK